MLSTTGHSRTVPSLAYHRLMDIMAAASFEPKVTLNIYRTVIATIAVQEPFRWGRRNSAVKPVQRGLGITPSENKGIQS